MKKLVFGAIAVFILSGSAIAGRYQANSLHRTYYSNSAKTQMVGEAWLPCPTYSNTSQGWIIEGAESSYFTETVGPACPQGPITYPDP